MKLTSMFAFLALAAILPPANAGVIRYTAKTSVKAAKGAAKLTVKTAKVAAKVLY